MKLSFKRYVNFDPFDLTQKEYDELVAYGIALERVREAAPKGCICHVKSADGYHGTSHANWCLKYTEALAAVDAMEGGE